MSIRRRISIANVATAGRTSGTYYYPSAAGFDPGHCEMFVLDLALSTNNSITIEATLDGVSWIDITMSFTNQATGAQATTITASTRIGIAGLAVKAIRVVDVAGVDNTTAVITAQELG